MSKDGTTRRILPYLVCGHTSEKGMAMHRDDLWARHWRGTRHSAKMGRHWRVMDAWKEGQVGNAALVSGNSFPATVSCNKEGKTR